MDTFNTNRLLNQKEIEERKIKLDSFARRLIVTLSSRCNLDCVMCEVKDTKWDIPQKTLREVIELFPYLESIIWQGGEPFLLDYFEDIFDRASNFLNLKQMIVTNGLLITEKWAEKLAGNKVELTFSIDALTKDVYERIREGAIFAKVMQGVKLMQAARNRSGSSKMTQRLHVVVMKSNYRQMDDFLDFAHNYGFSAVHFISMLGKQNQEENIFALNDKEAIAYIDDIREKLAEKAKKLNIEILNALPRKQEKIKDKDAPSLEAGGNNNGLGCFMPWQQLNIDPGGEVRPGCLCLKTVGSIFKDTLAELWNGDLMQGYRQKIIAGDFSPICNLTCLSLQREESIRKKPN